MGDNTTRRSVAALDSRSPVTIIRHDIRASGQRRRRGRPPRRHSEQRPARRPGRLRAARHRRRISAAATPSSVADFNKDGKLDVIANSLQAHGAGVVREPVVGAPRHRRRDAADREPGDGRHRRRRHPGDRVPERVRDAAGQQRRPQLDGAARRRPAAAVEGREDRRSSRPRTTSRGPISTATARRNCSTRRCSARRALAPTYDQDKASVFWYSPKDWKRHLVADDIPGIIHRVRPVMWDGNKREQFLVASFEGIALYRATGTGDGDEVREAAAVAGPRREGAAARRERRRRRQAGRQALLRLGRAVARQRGRRLHRKRRHVGSAASSTTRSRAATRLPSSTSTATAATTSSPTTTAASPSRTRTPTPGVHVFFAPADAAAASGSIGGSRTRRR